MMPKIEGERHDPIRRDHGYLRDREEMTEHGGPAMSMRTMPAVRRDSTRDKQNPFKPISLFKSDRIRTATVPTLPASVGVKNPSIKPPITRKKIIAIHNRSGRERILSPHVDLAPRGPIAGLILHQP